MSAWKFSFGHKILPFDLSTLVVAGLGLFFTGLLASTFTTFGLAKPATPDGSVQQGLHTPPSRDVSLLSQELIRVSKLTQAAVVNITSTGHFREDVTSPLPPPPFSRRFFDPDSGPPPTPNPDQPEQSMASGVIITTDGFILTNSHVVEGASDIRILLTDQRRFTAKVVGTDLKTDLAVLKIQATKLPFLPWGNSTLLQVGEIVVAVGNPFGLNQTVTMGIISAVGRANVGIVDFEDFIQTDAAINPGNSGGALVNLKGELIGINTAIFSESGGSMGIGFAIPSQMAKTVSKLLMEKGRVVRGWVGLSTQIISPALAKQFNAPGTEGVLIGDVTEGGPAQLAHIHRGDIIRSFQGKTVISPSQLRSIVAETSPGTVVKVVILRNGREQEIPVTVGELPPLPTLLSYSRQARGNHAMDGVIVEPLAPGRGQGDEGVLVSGVSPGSPAQLGGLQIADIIIEINRHPVRWLKDFEVFTQKLGPQESVLLLVRRGTGTLFLSVQRHD